MVTEKINAKEEKMFVIFMKVHSSKFTCYREYKHLNSIIKVAILLSFETKGPIFLFQVAYKSSEL